MNVKDNARVNIVMLLIEGPGLIGKVYGTALPDYEKLVSLLTK
jgi:hypothetical protein